MRLKPIETYLPLEALARAAANETRARELIRESCGGEWPTVFSFDFRSATFSGRDIKPVAAFVEGLIAADERDGNVRDMFFDESAAKINAREIFKAVCGKDAPTEVRFL